MSVIKNFKETIRIFLTHLKKYDLKDFSCMENECRGKIISSFESFETQIHYLYMEFERRFIQFFELENIVTFMAFPFKEYSTDCMDELCSNVSKLVEKDSNKVEEEIVKLCCDIYLKARATDINVPEFWKLLSEESYPNI